LEESLKKSSPLLEAELTSELGWVAESFIHLSFEDIWKHSRAFLGDPFWDLFILTNYCHISGENCEHYPLAFPSIPHLLLIHLYLYICIKFVYIFIYQYLYTAGIFCFKYFPFTSTFNFLHFFATYTSYRENTEVFFDIFKTCQRDIYLMFSVFLDYRRKKEQRWLNTYKRRVVARISIGNKKWLENIRVCRLFTCNRGIVYSTDIFCMKQLIWII